MAMTERIGNNRVAVGSTLLLISWIAPFASFAMQTVILFGGIGMWLAGAISRSGYSPKQRLLPPNTLGDKVVLFGAGVTVAAGIWFTFFANQPGIWVTPSIMPVLAICSLPYRRVTIEDRV